MTLKEQYKLYEERKIDDLIDDLEKLPPRCVGEFLSYVRKKGHTDWEEVFVPGHMTEEQYERFKYLQSSERTVKYFSLLKNDDAMTDQDWEDLRAADHG